MSNLLCSMLIGAGYDAYVVSGYATKEVCLADESRQICPLLIPPEKVKFYLKVLIFGKIKSIVSFRVYIVFLEDVLKL